jgi:hypothetical protein
MGQQFDRVAIVAPGVTENVILESQLMLNYGQRPRSTRRRHYGERRICDHLGAGDSSARRQGPRMRRTAPRKRWHLALFKLKEESNANV